MPRITIDYEIPRKKELIKEFTDKAVYSEDGQSVTVGHFKGTRRGVWSLRQYVGFDCHDLQRAKIGLPSAFFVHTDHRDPVQFAPYLAEKMAELTLTDEDRRRAAAAALEQRLQALKP